MRPHSAGSLTLDNDAIVTVTYPFHPLVGQFVLVVGDKEHGGTRYLIICKPGEGARLLLPEWMTFPDAGAIRILSCPRLCVNRLVELRALADRLMASSPGKQIRGGGQRNGTVEVVTAGSIQDITALRATVSTTKDGSGTAQDAPRRGDDVRRRPTSKRRQGPSGARQ